MFSENFTTLDWFMNELLSIKMCSNGATTTLQRSTATQTTKFLPPSSLRPSSASEGRIKVLRSTSVIESNELFIQLGVMLSCCEFLPRHASAFVAFRGD